MILFFFGNPRKSHRTIPAQTLKIVCVKALKHTFFFDIPCPSVAFSFLP